MDGRDTALLTMLIKKVMTVARIDFHASCRVDAEDFIERNLVGGVVGGQLEVAEFQPDGRINVVEVDPVYFLATSKTDSRHD